MFFSIYLSKIEVWEKATSFCEKPTTKEYIFTKFLINNSLKIYFSFQMVVKSDGNATWARGLFYNSWWNETKIGALPFYHVDFLISHISHFIWLCGVLNSGKNIYLLLFAYILKMYIPFLSLDCLNDHKR